MKKPTASAIDPALKRKNRGAKRLLKALFGSDAEARCSCTEQRGRTKSGGGEKKKETVLRCDSGTSYHYNFQWDFRRRASASPPN